MGVHRLRVGASPRGEITHDGRLFRDEHLLDAGYMRSYETVDSRCIRALAIFRRTSRESCLSPSSLSRFILFLTFFPIVPMV